MEKSVMVLGLDNSDCNFYALGWALQQLFFASSENPLFKLVVVYTKPSPSTVVGFAGLGSVDLLPIVDADLKKDSGWVLQRYKEIYAAKSVNEVVFKVVDGDARNVLSEAVERHHASVLVVGSHGYGAIKRAVLGSVIDYCAH